MVFPRTLCDDISSSDYGATDKASFSLSFPFLCLATAITGLAFIFLVVAAASQWPWLRVRRNKHDVMKTLREAANQRARLFSLSRFEVKVGYMLPGQRHGDEPRAQERCRSPNDDVAKEDGCTGRY
ncbi:hypothetical protein AVEN_109117-1 [Araneus ventricosus]|uniref:Uncharacterized protein n=1 Tax=Araneus ventricosus TaxID=182803 RepID=A0A4Y2QFX8_ARAVE|nr:hypothetical protein AVEN_109117-1 [Araneus ventricosus]